MLSHHELLHGLALISNKRLREFIDAIRNQRANKVAREDILDAVRQQMCQVASIDPKARIPWDANREVDLYAWGPMQLFFCVAWAFLDRYRYLKRLYPELVHAALDRYIMENGAGLDAAKKLRDWVLHPGYSRQPDDAMEMLFAAGGAPGNTYPQVMVNRLLELTSNFLEQLRDQAR